MARSEFEGLLPSDFPTLAELLDLYRVYFRLAANPRPSTVAAVAKELKLKGPHGLYKKLDHLTQKLGLPFTLFERARGSKCRVTENDNEVFKRVEDILRAYHNLKAAHWDQQKPVQLRIGAGSMLATRFLPDVLDRFHSQVPMHKVHVDVVVEEPNVLVDRAESDHCDFDLVVTVCPRATEFRASKATCVAEIYLHQCLIARRRHPFVQDRRNNVERLYRSTDADGVEVFDPKRLANQTVILPRSEHLLPVLPDFPWYLVKDLRDIQHATTSLEAHAHVVADVASKPTKVAITHREWLSDQEEEELMAIENRPRHAQDSAWQNHGVDGRRHRPSRTNSCRASPLQET